MSLRCMCLPPYVFKSAGRNAAGTGLRILTRQLRCGPRKTFRFALGARLTRPSTLEIVTDGDDQPPQAIDFQLDLVAVLECGQPAMIGARRQNVAGLEIVNG